MHESMIRIEKLLKAQDMDWADFARLLDVQKQHINNWKNRGISKNKAIEAAQKLDTSVDIILCDEAHGSTVIEAKSKVSATGSTKNVPSGFMPSNTSPKAQKIISDIIHLDSSGALTETYLDMLQSMVDNIPKQPNTSASAFRDNN